MQEKKAKKQTKWIAIIVLILTVIAVLVTAAGFAFAFYTNEHTYNDGILFNEFFFTSDCLTEDAPVYMIYEDSVVFNLYNNDGLNYTDDNNIRYSIEVTNGGELIPGDDYYKGSLDPEYPQLKQSGAEEGGSTHTYTLRPGENTDGTGQFTITAKSVAGYVLELSATFIFVDSGYYNITDHESYIVLDIYTGSNPPNNGKLKVTFAKYLAPDSSNPIMRSWRRRDYEHTVSVDSALEPFSHYELIFFKRDRLEDYAYTYTVDHVNGESLTTTIVINGTVNAVSE